MTSRKIKKMIVSINTILDYIQEDPLDKLFYVNERDMLINIRRKLEGELMIRKAMKVK